MSQMDDEGVMSEPRTVEEIARSLVGAGRPIIKRPRLTRLLDEAETRVILLVAPAGYGKTTLAHEWLDGRDAPSAWHTCTPASIDVAALAAGIAEAAEVVVPRCSERLRTRLRVTNVPESEVDVLAEILAEDLAEWPDDAWLCLDDYHFAVGSPASERFVERLLELVPLRLLLASRQRPAWATARRIMYGALTEVGTSALAMTLAEAGEVLATVKSTNMPGVFALADGWPAAIGLAAVMPTLELPTEGLPRPLYEYIADELYQSADEDLQDRLCELAVAPNMTTALLAHLFGSATNAVLEDAVRLGFLTLRGDNTVALHPLLRAFLESKLREKGSEVVRAAVRRVGNYLIDIDAWDDAFAVASRYEDRTLLRALVAASLGTTLSAGRLATLHQWVSHPMATDDPATELATAELAFCQADYAKAQSFAARAARAFEEDHLRARAFNLAGNAAYFRERRDDALNYFRSAKSSATTCSAMIDALSGELKTLLELETGDTDSVYEQLIAISAGTIEDAISVAKLKVFRGLRTGTISGALRDVHDILPLLTKSRDPLVRTSFLNVAAEAFILVGRYSKALSIAQLELADADTYRLDFVRPHGLAVKAAAELGLRDFRSALASLRLLETLAREHDEVHSQMVARATTVRVRIAQGALDSALREASTTWHRLPSRGMYGEYLATVALAQACAGRSTDARALANEAEELTSLGEARVSAAAARAIAALQDGDDAHAEIDALVESVRTTENYDSLVSAYRGHPPLLERVLPPLESHLMVVLHEARDREIAAHVGINIGEPPPSLDEPELTPREREVYELLLQGLRNREIAKTLYISEATAKVHVRNILQKLGVRSRTEAVARKAGD